MRSIAIIAILIMCLSCKESSKQIGDNENTSPNISKENILNSQNESLDTDDKLSSECIPNFVTNLSGNRSEIKCTLIEEKYIQVGADVLINGNRCDDLRVEGAKTFYCKIPRQSSPGVFDIHVTNVNLSTFIISKAIAYYNLCEPEQLLKIKAFYGDKTFIHPLCGIQPITFHIISGKGLMNSSNSILISPKYDDITTIEQEDAAGKKHLIEVTTIPHPLSLDPNQVSLQAGQKYSFQTSGGNPPYVYQLEPVTGNVDIYGNVSINTDTHKSSAILTVIDSRNQKAYSTISIDRLVINPSFRKITISTKLKLNRSGGVPPFQLTDGNAGGIFTNFDYEPNSIGNIQIKVIDSLGVSATTYIEVVPNLIISDTLVTQVGVKLNLSPLHGIPPYSYELLDTSIGDIDSNGAFIAHSPGETNLSIKDSFENTVITKITVQSNLHIDYSSSMPSIGKQQLTVNGGKPPYYFRVDNGMDEITSDGIFRSIWNILPADVIVTDSLNFSKKVTINKQASVLVNSYNFNTINVSIDEHGNLIINKDLANSENKLIINKFGEIITSNGSTLIHSNIFQFSSMNCLNGGSIRDVSSFNNGVTTYLIREWACWKIINESLYNPYIDSNYGFSNYWIEMISSNKDAESIKKLNLPSPKTIFPNHYQAIVADNDGNFYIFAWLNPLYSNDITPGYQAKLMIWKFNKEGILQ